MNGRGAAGQGWESRLEGGVPSPLVPVTGPFKGQPAARERLQEAGATASLKLAGTSRRQPPWGLERGPGVPTVGGRGCFGALCGGWSPPGRGLCKIRAKEQTW